MKRKYRKEKGYLKMWAGAAKGRHSLPARSPCPEPVPGAPAQSPAGPGEQVVRAPFQARV